MSTKKYHVTLTSAQREELTHVGQSQRCSERERKRARILLLADETREGGALTDTEIAVRVKVVPLTVNRVRQRFTQRDLEAAIHRKEQGNRKERRLDGKGEAALIALTCSNPPQGYKRWSLRLLKNALIEQKIVDAIGQETIRQTLKKIRSNPG